MPQTIDVPGVGQVQFPDGMDDGAIVKAIQGMQPQKAAAPADGVGTMQAGLIGAGRKTDSILDGLAQMYLGARGEKAALGGLQQNVAAKQELYQPLKEAHPLATGVGEAVPMMAVPVGRAGALGTVMRAGAASALPDLLSYGSAEERLKNGAVSGAGGMLGGALGVGVGRLLKPAGQGVPALSKEAQQAAQRVGVKLSPGQMSQNPAMQNFENYLARSPGSSGTMQAQALANQEAMNTAAAGAMGQKAADLSEGTFAAAKRGIGSEFERLQQITAPDLGNDFLNTLARIDSANAARGSFRSKAIDGLIDKGLDLAAQNKLTGTAYKEIRTAISSDAQSAFKAGDATLGQALKQVRKALDDAAKGSLSAADQKAWDTTREQWAAYKALTKSNVAEGGNVSAARLAGALRQQGDGLRTGAMQGPLSDIARLGESVKGVQNPNSGQLVNQMIYGNPLTGVPAMLGNKVAGAAYNSPMVRAYLAKGLLDIGPNGQLILGKIAGPLGTPVAQQYLGAQ
jgi:hypothetical protein